MIHRWRALSIISVGIIKLCTKISLALVSSSILRRPAICLQSCRLSVSTTGTSTMVTGTSTMVTGTRKSQTVLLPSGRFVGCWPVGLGQYNGGAAVFLAKERRILNPREEVLPIPITEDAVSLLSEASEWTDLLFVEVRYWVPVRVPVRVSEYFVAAGAYAAQTAKLARVNSRYAVQTLYNASSAALLPSQYVRTLWWLDLPSRVLGARKKATLCSQMLSCFFPSRVEPTIPVQSKAYLHTWYTVPVRFS